MLTPTGLTIGRLRVQRGGSPDADPRQSAARAFGMLDIRPGTLPRGATLCVRRLVDPAPGRLSLDLRDAADATGWRTRVEGALADLARHAARPADGPVPAGADAVLFRDDVELLACLAADWSQPGGSSNWWWRRLVPSRPDDVVARTWRSKIHAVPPVVDLLDTRRELAAALAAIDDGGIVSLIDALVDGFGLTLPAGWRESVTRSEPAVLGQQARGAAGTSRDPRARLRPRARPPAAGRAELPEPRGDPAMLDLPRLLFAGIALCLVRSPAMARTAGFAAAIRGMLGIAVPLPVHVPAGFRRTRAAVATPGSRRPDEGAPARTGDPARRSRPGKGVGAGASRPPATAAAAPAPARARRATPVAAPRPDAPATPVIQPDHALLAMTEPLHTDLGGVFFLLNLAIYLGLYGDFSQPREPGIELDPWDLLTLLAGDLGVGEELAADPLGDLLRRLAGRPKRSRPGEGWHPGDEWRVPRAWLDPFGVTTGAWRWSAARGRLRVDHPAGFRVLDISAPPRPTPARVRRALGPAARRLIAQPRPRLARAARPLLRRAAVPGVPASGRRPVDRWIALLGGYAAARLRLALGLDSGADLGVHLLRLRARVSATPIEVDVEFELAELPIEIRVAGLDRDPGWIPAARRAVRFHFR